MLGEVVVDDQRVLAALHEVLGHCDAGVGSEVLLGGGLGGGGVDHDRVVHGAVFLERGDDIGHLGLLLANGDVDADQVLTLLVDDRVDRDRGLTSLAVADDQLALAAADGNLRVNGEDAGLDGRVDGGSGHHVGRDALNGSGLVGVDRALAVDRLAERVDDATDELFADGDLGDGAGGADFVAFFDHAVVTHDHRRRRFPLRGSAPCP